MSDIGTLIQDQLIQAITDNCQTAIPDGDPARLTLVKKGEYQDDPEGQNIVCVHRNDPDKTERAGKSAWLDERYSTEMGLLIGSGGQASPEHWYRRLTVEIICWPAGELQDQAESINGTVVARVRRAVTTLNLTGLKDDFGEAIEIGINPIQRMKTDEGGGPDDEYNWKTFLYLEYGTIWRP